MPKYANYPVVGNLMWCASCGERIVIKEEPPVGLPWSDYWDGILVGGTFDGLAGTFAVHKWCLEKANADGIPDSWLHDEIAVAKKRAKEAQKVAAAPKQPTAQPRVAPVKETDAAAERAETLREQREEERRERLAEDRAEAKRLEEKKAHGK